jgi:hypothetical protein
MKKIIMICTAIAAIFLLAAIKYVAPLIPTNELRVTYECEGKMNDDTRVFAPLFASGVYYINLPQSASLTYRWFLIKEPYKSVSVPNVPRGQESKMRYVHRDQILGVELLDPKIQDKWTVAFRDKSINFSNGKLTVTVEKR